MHDPIYRRLFAFPRMVADLLRAVGHPDWLGDIDLNTLEKLPAEHIGDSGQQRRFAAGRFGEVVGERVESLLGDTEDWDRLSAAAEVIAAAKAEVELIDGVSGVVRQGG